MPERTSPSIKDRISLGIAAFLILFLLVDFGGDYIAVVALKAAYHSRKDDCNAAEVLRARGRARIARERTEYASNLALLHIANSPKIEALARKSWREGEALLRHVDCTGYANKALPW